jgi:hypothetical protein
MPQRVDLYLQAIFVCVGHGNEMSVFHAQLVSSGAPATKAKCLLWVDLSHTPAPGIVVGTSKAHPG